MSQALLAAAALLLPIHEPERFVRLYTSYARADPYFTFSHPDFVDIRALGDVFTDAVAERPDAFTVQIGGAATTNSAAFVSQIGFPSTKLYVKSVMRRYALYKFLARLV